MIAFVLNGGTFSDDILTRSIVVAMSLRNKSNINYDFNILNYVKRYRLEIIAELAKIVSNSFKKPNSTYEVKSKLFKFKKWAHTMGTILSSNKMYDFLANQDSIKMKSDPVIKEIESLIDVKKIISHQRYSPRQIVEMIYNDSCFDGESDISNKTKILGRKLTLLDGSYIGLETLFRINKTSSGNNPKYSFIPSGGENGDNQDISSERDIILEFKSNEKTKQEYNSQNSEEIEINPLEGYSEQEIKELLKDTGKHHDNI